MVIDIQPQTPAQVILDQLGEAGVAVDAAFGGADYVVAVREEAGEGGGRGGRDVEDVPYRVGGGEGGPLEGEAEGGAGGWDGEGEGAC